MIIDGKQIAQEILDCLRKKIAKEKVIPHLAIILVGDDPASLAYVRQKEIKAQSIGAKTTIKKLSSKTTTSQLLKIIKTLNKNEDIHGIIVQQPLPSQINIDEIVNSIDPKKDVDGFHPKSHFEMPIALAVLRILKKTCNCKNFDEWLKSKNIAIVGKGKTGGKPLIQMFKKMKIKPIVIDSKTKNPQKITRTADVVISAVGKPQIIKKDMLKKGVILIGLGMFKGQDGKLHGDYQEDDVKDIASFYTPIPGGIGPTNVAMLLKNLVKSC